MCRSNEDIIQLIKEGEHDDIGAEKLRGFLKILPEVDELALLNSFDGDIQRLGKAEKFLLQLLQVSKYELMPSTTPVRLLIKNSVSATSYESRECC